MKRKLSSRVLDTKRDKHDFRDKRFVPPYIRLRREMALSEYQELDIPVLDQGEEGACTGFALATVVHFYLRSEPNPDLTRVSPHMIYNMAKKHDEWAGESYEGSSCRGALKGWSHYGVCSEKAYKKAAQELTELQLKDASKRPLGSYFRVNSRSMFDMHCALNLAGIVYASASVHEGWDSPRSGVIPLKDQVVGGHAFAIVGYNAKGFVIQNSWGRDWGINGLAVMTYDDWRQNGDDSWIVSVGVAA